MNCFLCGSGDNSILYCKEDTDNLLPEKYKMVKCNSCGFTYVDPIPDEQEMKRLYNFNAYYGVSDNGKGYFQAVEDFFYTKRVKKIESFKNSIKRSKTNCGRILDIGCGSGKFLFFMKKRGWDVYGVESSKSGVTIGSEIYSINVFNGSLKEANYPEHFFDCITLWHVLEHIPTPTILFREIKRIIKPGGVVFIAVPNIESLEAKIFGEKWFHLDIPRHLCHYSPATLKMLAFKSGFKIIDINYFSLEYNLSGLLQSLLNYLGCEFNFFYNRIKRGDKRGTDYYTAVMSWTLATIGLPIILLLTEIASLLKLSGCIEAQFIAEEK